MALLDRPDFAFRSSDGQRLSTCTTWPVRKWPRNQTLSTLSTALQNTNEDSESTEGRSLRGPESGRNRGHISLFRGDNQQTGRKKFLRVTLGCLCLLHLINMASAIASSASRALVSPANAAVVQRQNASKQFCMPIACRPSSIAESRPAGVRCQASSEQTEAVHLGRREALIAGLAGLAVVGAVAPPEAHADQLEEYKEDTKSIIGQIRTALDLDKKDPAKPDAVNSLLENSTGKNVISTLHNVVFAPTYGFAWPYVYIAPIEASCLKATLPI